MSDAQLLRRNRLVCDPFEILVCSALMASGFRSLFEEKVVSSIYSMPARKVHSYMGFSKSIFETL